MTLSRIFLLINIKFTSSSHLVARPKIVTHNVPKISTEKTLNKGLLKILRNLGKVPNLPAFRTGQIREFSLEIRLKTLFLGLIAAKLVYKGDL